MDINLPNHSAVGMPPNPKFNLGNLQNLVNAVVGEYPSRPYFQPVSRVGGTLMLAGAGGPGNALYYLLSSGTLTLPLANWTTEATNNFDISGAFSMSVNLSVTNQQ